MNDFAEYLTVYPCRLGCTKKDEAGNEIPLPGDHEGYCERCYGAIVGGLEQAAPLIYHLLTMVPTALRSKPASLGNQRTKAATTPLPFDVNARDDAERVWMLMTGVRYLPVGISNVAARAAVREATEKRLRALDTWLAQAEVDAVGRAKANSQWIRRTVAKWPTQDKPVLSSITVCPLDAGRILIVPPLEPGGDQTFICSTCGNMLTEAEHEQYGRYLKAMFKGTKAHRLEQAARLAEMTA